MSWTINRLPDDLAVLNEALSQLTTNQKGVLDLNQQVAKLQKLITANGLNRTVNFEDNAVFTWTGASATLSWPQFSMTDASGNVVPGVAGTKILSPSTYYWIAYNPLQQTYSFSTVRPSISQTSNNTVVALIYTGTSGQTGAAGGGGTTPGGYDLIGQRYKLF